MSAYLDELISALPPDSSYPSGIMAPLSPFLLGRSFFPGGAGLYGGRGAAMPTRPIMIVGQDFGDMDYVSSLRAKALKDEPLDGTWSLLLSDFLQPAGINPSTVFFTNAILGSRGFDGMTSPSAALNERVFVAECERFFGVQLRVVQPSVVVTLGVVPTTLVACWLRLAPSLRLPRSNVRPTIGELDRLGLQFIPNVANPDVGDLSLGWSIHPANGRPNLRHRKWESEGLVGEPVNAEVWRRAKAARDKVLG